MVTENINIIITTRGARVAQNSIRGIGRSSRVAATAVRALSVALATIGVGLGLRELFRLSDAATQVGNRIRTVTSSTEVFLSVQDRLFDVASRTGGAIEDTARLYQRLSVGTRDIGVGSARVIRVVEELNAALVVSGSTTREASAALLQLGQGLASDNLSGEELRSLRENLPQLAQALASELDVGIGALKELGRQGKLTAKDVFEALENIDQFSKQLGEGDVVFTFAQAFDAVRNAILRAITIIQNATGITQSLTKVIFDQADGLEKKLVRALATAVEFLIPLIDNFELVKNQIGDVIDIIKVFFKVISTLRGLAGIIIDILLIPFALVREVIAQLILDTKKVGNFFGLEGSFFSDESVAESKAKARETTEFVKALFADIGEEAVGVGKQLGIGLDGAEKKLTPLQQGLQDFADGIRAAADAEIPVVDDPDRDPAPRDDPAAAAAAKARVDANKELVKLLRDRRLAELALINPRLEQVELLNEQIAKVDALRAAGGDQVLAEREINDLIRERNELLAQTDFGQELAEGITGSVQEAFAASVKSGENFVDALSANLEGAANEALIGGFEKSFAEIQKGLGKAFDAVAKSVEGTFGGAFKSLGPVVGDAISGALQFAALQGLNALLGGGGNESSSSAGNVQSAVTSTQAVRGIVAGPQEIAIANVGANIADAIGPLLEETRVQTAVLRAGFAGLGTGTGADSDLEALANGGAPLAAS